jgi:hypothetical protein
LLTDAFWALTTTLISLFGDTISCALAASENEKQARKKKISFIDLQILFLSDPLPYTAKLYFLCPKAGIQMLFTRV